MQTLTTLIQSFTQPAIHSYAHSSEQTGRHTHIHMHTNGQEYAAGQKAGIANKAFENFPKLPPTEAIYA